MDFMAAEGEQWPGHGPSLKTVRGRVETFCGRAGLQHDGRMCLFLSPSEFPPLAAMLEARKDVKGGRS